MSLLKKRSILKEDVFEPNTQQRFIASTKSHKLFTFEILELLKCHHKLLPTRSVSEISTGHPFQISVSRFFSRQVC